MKGFISYQISILLVIASISTTATASIFDRPFVREAMEYHKKLVSWRYEEIEKAAKDARENDLKTSDGQPLLSAIYGGISGCEDVGCRYLTDIVYWNLKKEKLEEWMSKHPESTTAKVGYAGYFIQLGWFYRGKGYAKTVSDQSMSLYKENLEKARILLEDCSEEVRKDAGWNYAMLEVAFYQGWPKEEFEKIYNKAITLHPNYLPIYFLKANYLHPKWHGSRDEYKAYIGAVVEATKPEFGNELYARLHWSSSGRDLFSRDLAEWKLMSKGFEEITAKYPDIWNVNNYAKYSCLAGDKQKLSELLILMGNQVKSSAWYSDKKFYESCVEFADLK